MSGFIPAIISVRLSVRVGMPHRQLAVLEFYFELGGAPRVLGPNRDLSLGADHRVAALKSALVPQ